MLTVDGPVFPTEARRIRPGVASVFQFILKGINVWKTATETSECFADS
jgi:hypothetical protein